MVLDYLIVLSFVIGEYLNVVMQFILINFYYNYIFDDENVIDFVKFLIVCMENFFSLLKCVIIIGFK